MPPSPALDRPSGLYPFVALLFGVLGMSSVWTTVAVLSDSPQGWLALVAALDMVVLLRIAGATPGPGRALAAGVATALTVLASYWMIASTEFGLVLGLRPLESAIRMGPVLAWELTRLTTSPWDAAFALVAVPWAAWASRRPRRG